MAIIDPNKVAGEGGPSGGGGFRECGPGKKVLFPIGHRYREVNGNPVVDVRSVCIEDPTGEGDGGATVTDTMWLTDRAMWRVARFALAVGFNQPFDPEDPEDMDRVLLSGPFVGDVSIRTRGDRQYRDLANYEPATGFRRNDRTGEVELTAEQREWVESAERGWRALLAKGSRGGYGSGGSRGGGRSRGGGYRGNDDEIPF